MKLQVLTAIAVAMVSALASADQPLHLNLGVSGSVIGGYPVVFVGDSIRVTVLLRYGPDVAGPEVPLPTVEWEKAIDWVILDRNTGQERHIDGSSIRVIETLRDWSSDRGKRIAQMRQGETLQATIELAALPKGDYSVGARLAMVNQVLQSELVPLKVRTGDEDQQLREVRLRELAFRIRSTPARSDSREDRRERWTRYREVMTKLAEVSPRDPGIWEDLGDVSIGQVSPEETRAYYERALSLSESNLIERYGSLKNLPPDVREYGRRRERELSLYARQVFPYQIQNPGVRIIPFKKNQQEQKIFLAFPKPDQRIEFRDEERTGRGSTR